MKDDILKDLPMGFGMALAQNPEALEVFSGMSDEEKREVIDGTHRIRSKNEMRRYVDGMKNRKPDIML
ncbi:MAG: hypothetical protein PUB42_03605 [Firmicutes bacterium]|nr:hypothetical protein [Bacillota bacterium]